MSAFTPVGPNSPYRQNYNYAGPSSFGSGLSANLGCADPKSVLGRTIKIAEATGAAALTSGFESLRELVYERRALLDQLKPITLERHVREAKKVLLVEVEDRLIAAYEALRSNA